MARNAGLLLLIFVIMHAAHAASRFSALTASVYATVEEQHYLALQSAEAAWRTAQTGVSYDLRVRPSYRYRTATDPLLRLRVGAGVSFAPQPPAIARAELAVRKAQHAKQLAYIRAVEAELNMHLDVHVATRQHVVAEHQVHTAAENLRQLQTAEDYSETLVAHAEITLREAERNLYSATTALATADAALVAPYTQLFATDEVFSWRFALAPPPISEHPYLAVLVAEAEVAAALLHEQRFRPVQALQLVGTLEAGEFSASGTVKYARGAPSVVLTGEYDTAGTAERFTLELAGDFVITDQTLGAIRAAENHHEQLVQRAVNFLTSQPLIVSSALVAALQAAEALTDAQLLVQLAADALASAPERQAVRLQNEYDRALTALHRSWRQYVRAVRNYLEESGGVWELGET